jgi:hypothetical protein
MAMPLVLNTLQENAPGAGRVRLGMDFGNVPEVLAGDLVESCAISVLTVTSPALSLVPGSTEVEGGYVASAEFTGGKAAQYSVSFTPTLESGQTLPPRIGILELQ